MRRFLLALGAVALLAACTQGTDTAAPAAITSPTTMSTSGS
jgi:nitrous oxide reductase accessory protein NosL